MIVNELEPRRLFEERDREPSPTVIESIETGEGVASDRALLCATCRARLTSERERITVGGSHEHSGVNPHGYTYRFGCFRSVPGCVSRGVPSTQFTWFPGHHWLVQNCLCCTAHIGWLFFASHDPGDEFFGLVLDALVRDGD